MKILNHLAKCLDTDGDVYSGYFTNECKISKLGIIKYFYMISFKPGTQARGHEIADFKLYQMADDGTLIYLDNSNGLFDDVLKEILKGF